MSIESKDAPVVLPTHETSAGNNPLQPHGIALLLFAAGAAVLAILGLAVYGGNNLPWAAVAGVAAAVAAVRGLMLYLQPFAWPAGAPEGINGQKSKVHELLGMLPSDNSFLGTYRLPTGFWELIVRAVAPHFSYQTPATRGLIRGVGRGIGTVVACVVVGLILASNNAPGAGIILALGGISLAGIRLFVLYRTVPDLPPGNPQVVDRRLRLTQSGNPAALFRAAHIELFDPIRDGDTDGRLYEVETDSGDRRKLTTFKGTIAFESKPFREPSNPEHVKAAGLLEFAAVATALFGVVVFLFAKPTPENMPFKFAGMVIAGFSGSLMWTAFYLRNTFRFRSDLFAVTFDGTVQSQRAGGEGAGFGEIDRVKSDIHIRIVGTRVLSECTLSRYDLPGGKGKTANVKALQATWSALTSPRYLVRTAVDARFQAKLDHMIQALEGFQDTEGDVMGANEDSAGAVKAIQSKMLREQEQEMFKQRLMLQAQVQNQILAKALEGKTPAEALQMLSQVGGIQSPQFGTPGPPPLIAAGRPLPAPPPVVPVPPPGVKGMTPQVEKMLADALRVAYSPTQSKDAKELARQMIDRLKKAHGLHSPEMREVANRVRAELGLGKLM